ncbi:hypothetical protein LCGC14_0142330 [marine sediment metagenome]|uniref:Uncharacterized protein n=1 Tax=marine sediment metagenome TaxID=412755 RepID=A0A0F9Y2U2_9ZZZZ
MHHDKGPVSEYVLKTGDEVSISCTWGEGPDVCVNVELDLEKMGNYWPKGFFPMDFTGDEAIMIGRKLIECGNRAKELDLIVENEGKI